MLEQKRWPGATDNFPLKTLPSLFTLPGSPDSSLPLHRNPACKKPRFWFAPAITNFTGLFSSISTLHHGTQEGAQPAAAQLLLTDSSETAMRWWNHPSISGRNLGETWPEEEEAIKEAGVQPGNRPHTQRHQAALEAAGEALQECTLPDGCPDPTAKARLVNPSSPALSHSSEAMQPLTACLFTIQPPFNKSSISRSYFNFSSINHRPYSSFS